MINNETHLLYSVLCYEEGHCRRTQHILKVYALAKLFGEQEKISVEDQQILQAAAILHDVAIKYCKEHYNGDASQNNQKQVVSILVTRFLESANYLPSYVPKIIELVNCHHDYDKPKNKLNFSNRWRKGIAGTLFEKRNGIGGYYVSGKYN